MEYTTETRAPDLVTALNKQRKAGHLCDVRLVVGDDVIPAHRCVLSASCEYFRVLFLGDFGDCGSDECHMSTCECKALQSVVEYIYTGNIAITLHNVDAVLGVTDYLCITDIKSFCSDFLRRHLGLTNCIQIKALTDRFALDDIRADVMDYLIPRMLPIMKGREILDIPFTYIYSLLTDKQLNYIREPELLEFIFRWINHSPDERSQHMAPLIHCVDFSYLGSEFIEHNIINCKDISAVLRPDQRDKIHIKLSQQSFPTRQDDVIVCRSSPGGQDKAGQLLVYMVSEDRWYSVSSCPDPRLLTGLQSICCDQNSMYLLTKTTLNTDEIREPKLLDNANGNRFGVTPDLLQHADDRLKEQHMRYQLHSNREQNIYRHQQSGEQLYEESQCHRESNHPPHQEHNMTNDYYHLCENRTTEKDSGDKRDELWKVNMDRGSWKQLPSPDQLCTRSCLVPHERGLYIIHPAGVVDKYDNLSNKWVNFSGPGFSGSPAATIRILPVTTDRFIYTLRVFSVQSISENTNMDNFESGSHKNVNYSLHRYDTERYTWTTLTQIEHTDHMSLHSCAFDTSTIMLKDILGHDRLTYDIMTGKYTRTGNDTEAAPRLLSEMWGSCVHEDSVYVSGCIGQEAVFMLYNHTQSRYKMLCHPPGPLSATLKHMVLPRAFRNMLSAH